METNAPWNPTIKFTIIWPFNPLFELNWTVEFEDDDDDDEEEEEEVEADATAASMASTTPLMASLFSSSSLFLAWLSVGASA